MSLKNPQLAMAAALLLATGMGLGALVSQTASSDAKSGTGDMGVAATALRESRASTSAQAQASAESATAAMGPERRAASAESSAQSPGREEDEARTRALLDTLERLSHRVAALERLVQEHLPGARADDPAARPERRMPRDSRERVSVLVEAGVGQERAEEIEWSRGQFELDRLELRDLAMREGWHDSERYRQELAALEAEEPPLRTELGDEAYDRYLYRIGMENRVVVESVIPGSAAEQAGLQIGDRIERYDARRLFSYADVRHAMIDGERDDLVAVEISRGDELLEAWVARGPLGVRLDGVEVDPDAVQARRGK